MFRYYDIILVEIRENTPKKERENDGQLSTSLINIQLEEADKCTFLYIRNGKQVYCLQSDLDFGELIFPDKATIFVAGIEDGDYKEVYLFRGMPSLDKFAVRFI